MRISRLALLLTVAAGTTLAEIFYAGVSESGGEFGVWSPDKTLGTGLPGEFGVDYRFINRSHVDIFVDKHKINVFRVAFLLERMCPLKFGLGSRFNETHFSVFQDAIHYITLTKGAYAIIDPHNYLRYGDPSSQPFSGPIIGDSSNPASATIEAYARFWGELARRFRRNQRVIFGLMNEPHGTTTANVFASNQAAISAIRRVKARQLILAPGNAWSACQAWTEGDDPSSAVMNQLRDPINNTAIDCHYYPDPTSTGTSPTCAHLASTALAPLTAWLRKHNRRALISEFGAAPNAECGENVADLLAYLDENDEYIGWTAYAAGPVWGSVSPCCTGGEEWGSLEPGSLARDGGPGMYKTVWLEFIQPLLPKSLQWKGITSINGGPSS